MPPARAVFLFPPSGYNVYTSISPVERRYALFEGSNVKLYCRQEKACRTHLQAFIAYAVIYRRFIRPRKRRRRVPAAFRRLFIRPSGCSYLRLSLRSFRLSASVRPFDLSGAICCIWSAGQAVHAQQVRRGASGQGGFVSVPSALVPLSAPFCPLLSTCSRVVSRKVVRSKVVRES